MTSKYKFIVVEGPDGVGKTTVSKLLSERIVGSRNVRFPGYTEVGKKIRQLFIDSQDLNVVTQFHMMLADYAQTLAEINKSGYTDTVIADRFFFSAFVYQGLSGLSPDDIYSSLSNMMHSLGKNLDVNPNHHLVPDLIVLLKASKAEVAKRFEARGVAADRFEETTFAAKVFREYYELTELATTTYSGFHNVLREMDFELRETGMNKFYVESEGRYSRIASRAIEFYSDASHRGAIPKQILIVDTNGKTPEQVVDTIGKFV